MYSVSLIPMFSSDEDEDEAERSWAESVLLKNSHALKESQLKVTTAIRDGNPKNELPRIAEEWDKLDQCIIDKAVKQWRSRLRACVAAGGAHFEYKL